MPKILFILQSLANGGAERVSLNLIQSLKRLGYSIRIIVIQESCHDKALIDHEKQDAYLLNRKNAKSAIFQIINICNRENPDFIFSNMSHLNLLLGIVRNALNKNSILIVRETCLLSKNNANYKLNKFWDFLYRRFYKNVDFLICQSQAMKNDLVNNYCFPDEKCSVLPNPIDQINIDKLAKSDPAAEGLLRREQKTKEKERPLDIIFIGHYREQKNIFSLIEAMSLTKNTNANLHLIGEGCTHDELTKLSKTLLLKNIHLYGFQRNPYKFLRNADALVIPSFYEGFPNVLLEAIYLRKCVITTPWEGISELDEKIMKFCFVADDFTSISIARAIDMWACHHPLKVKKDLLTEFYSSNVAQKYHLLFQDLML